MKRQKKVLSSVLLLIIAVLIGQKSFAMDLVDKISPIEYTEEFKEYLQLPEEERSKRMVPNMFKIEGSYIETKNPFKLLKSSETTNEKKFSLKDVIANNVSIRNQQTTNACWTFAALSSLETNLALNGGDSEKIYDFSERHMEYATSRIFANNIINQKGLNRKVGDGGNWYMVSPYLTNGNGAIDEELMPFENNENIINISEIQNKTVTSEVHDTVMFVAEDTTQLKQQVKNHVKNYGSVFTMIHGASIFSDYYNNETGAIYCDDAQKCPVNHAVSIIGWDDDYPIENFNEEHRPTNKGAWIIRNSWGDKNEYTLEEMKEIIFTQFSAQCQQKGWTEASQIPDKDAKELFIENGYTIENDKAVLRIGDNGYMYLSYEDVNVYTGLSGIEKASNSIDYENIYQYDELGAANIISFSESKAYIANIFDKKSSGKEYLTQVSLDAPEAYTCTVYVNPNGTSMAKSDLKQVQLKAGSFEKINAGYHTLEFSKPIEITSDNFVVVIEIQGTRANNIYIATEANIPNTPWDVVEVESTKCFVTGEGELQRNEWYDLSAMSKNTNGKLTDCDSSIKAFTVSKINEEDKEDPETPPSGDEDKDPETPPSGDDNKDPETPPSEDQDKDKAKNSDLTNAKATITGIKAEFSTDNPKTDYAIMKIEVNGITRNLTNDTYEYYYYLSPNQAEENIEDWVKINEKQDDENKLTFEINTNDVKNYDELAKSDTLYLYIKEVVTKGESKAEAVSKSMLLELNVDIDNKVDGEKPDKDGQTENNSNPSKDPTVATMNLPNTGMGIVIIVIMFITIIGIVIYVRYKKLSKYVK